ncbi:MAG: S9 family peptidase [Chitinophagaceae bacterium]|nr:S9 family peptidase [Chitinophagaceae bacterium]MBK9531102.1 S9 family peptidase [Chitinophagaceae bacterium]
MIKLFHKPVIALLVMATVIFAACKNKTKSEEPAPKIAVEDFFKNPEKFSWLISPDGEYISYLSPHNGHTNVFVQKISDSVAIPVTNDTMRNIYRYQWKGNRIIYLQDVGGDENFQLFSVAMDGKDLKALTPFPKVRTEILDGWRDIAGKEKEVMVGINKRDARFFDPYSINIETGELKVLYENNNNYESWFTDHAGIIRMATKTDGVNTTYFHRATEAAPFDSILTTSYKDQFSIQFFTFDNKNIYVSSNIGRDKTAIVEYDLAARKEIKEIYSNPDYDVNGLSFSAKRKVLTLASYTSWKGEQHFLDKETESEYKKMQDKFKGYEIGIYGNNIAEDKFVVWTGNDKVAARYHFYDKKTGETKFLADAFPWLKEEEMATMKPVKYTSRDGLTIHGYLTLPKGMEARNLPVVINPHGGPWARDEWGFNNEAQLFANRGYAVLQMNFRGSTGYGKEFWLKSQKQWGKTMQDDITDGVQWLIKEGIADPKRVAIYGGSYGGYATLAGVAFTPDLYACAVDYVGVSNMFTFMKTIPPYWEPYKAMFYEMVGDPVKDSALLAEVSPALHAGKIKTPLFVAQGANDPRVNKDESDQMVEALRKRGVLVDYMVKNDEGHGFANEGNRLEFYKEMDKFFDKYLSGKPVEPKKQ